MPSNFYRARSVRNIPLFAYSLLPLVLSGAAHAAGAPAVLPAGGMVVAGQAAIETPSSSSLTVTQSSSKAIINWTGFSIGSGDKVQFNNGTGATLNRVTGTNASSLNGVLSATGSLYLLNPNGVIVGRSGVVNVGGTFVASTLNVSNANFLAGGNLSFTGSSNAAVVNLGKVGALGGDVALIAATVDNEGSITAANGTAGLVSGYSVVMRDASLDDGMFSMLVGGPNTGVTNGGAILAANAELRAEGGNVYALAGNTVGVIRATGLRAGQGKVWLVADGGTLDVAGTIEAQGNGGGKGAIETSGHSVSIGAASIDAHGGTWLVDPTDLTIDATAASTIDIALNAGTSVTEQTTATGSSGAGTANANGNGDIIVAAPISWSTGAGLNLEAYRNVDVNAAITSTGGGAILLQADNAATGTGTVAFSGGGVSTSGTTTILYNPTSFAAPTNYSDSVTGGGALIAYMLINTEQDLQNIDTNLAGTYGLNPGTGYQGISGDLMATPGFNFTPIGTSANPFTGTFDGAPTVANHNGQGYIENLVIDAPNTDYVGLFGRVAAGGVVQNVDLRSATVTGHNIVGSVVGENDGLVANVLDDGSTTGANEVGGMVGRNTGTVDQAAAGFGGYGPETITGAADVGGVIGDNAPADGATTSTAMATELHIYGSVSGTGNYIGGMIGSNAAGSTVSTTTGAISFATVNGGSASVGVGGIAGYNAGTVSGFVFSGQNGGGPVTNTGGVATGGIVGLNDTGGVVSGVQTLNATVEGGNATGGIVGKNYGTVGGGDETYDSAVSGADAVGGVVGKNFALISNSYADNGTTVSGVNYVGGVAGWNTAPAGSTSPSTAVIQNDSYAGGSTMTTGTGNYVGGVTGSNDVGATIVNSSGNGTVTGPGAAGGYVGSVAGYNAGTITGSTGSAAVQEASANTGSGADYLGGLVGYNASTGTISGSSSSGGSVTGSFSDAGGLVGYNAGVISGSSAHYTTTTTGAGSAAGGLIGYNASGATLIGGSAAGSVTISAAVNGATSDAGGLIGVNFATISNVSSSASVSESGTSDGSAANLVGGLVGDNTTGGMVTAASASGGVSGQGADDVGGLIGLNDGVAGGGLSASGGVSLSNSAGGDIGGLVGLNTRTVGDNTAASFATGLVTIDGTSNAGGLVGSNTGSITQAYASGDIADNGFSSMNLGGLVGTNSGSISYVYALGQIQGADFDSGAWGSLIGVNTSSGTVTQAYATGSIQLGRVSRALSEGGVAGTNAGLIADSVYYDQQITGQHAPDGGNTGTDNAVAINTNVNNSPSLASSYPDLDFGQGGFVILQNSTRPFLRSEASSTIINLHQLELAQLNLAGNYVLAANIDASPTAGANGSDMWSEAGFASIGTNATPFTGTFNGADPTTGLSHTITDLTINRGETIATGLFGSIGSTGLVGNLVLTGGSITGNNATGAVAGKNYGVISNVVVTGSMAVAGEDAVGGVVGKNFGTVAYATDSISAVTGEAAVIGADYVGGVVGWNTAPAGSGLTSTAVVSDVVATTNVGGTGNDIGGVVGASDAGSLIFNPFFSGQVGALNSVGSLSGIGGVAGYNAGVVTGVEGSNTVTETTVFGGASTSNVGGVVGYNAGSVSDVTVENTSVNAEGAGTGISGYGGVVGYNSASASLTGASAFAVVGGSGAVNAVGGLVGKNYGLVGSSQFGSAPAVEGSSASSAAAGQTMVAGLNAVGGAVGENFGTVSNVAAYGAVAGQDYVGGLVGWNTTPGSGGSFVSASVSDAVVSGAGDVGGLVGRNDAVGVISGSWALGETDLSGAATSQEPTAGGLVGYNAGIVNTSYATGYISTLRANTSTVFAGGLIGDNFGQVSDVYSYATISSNAGPYRIGGLVGANEQGATLSDAYASGNLDVAEAPRINEYVGGVVGSNAGSVAGVYFDQTTTGVSQGVGFVGAASNGTAAITAIGGGGADPFAQGTYQGFDFTNTWFMVDGSTRPMLRSEYSTTVTNAHQLQLMALDTTATYTLAADIDASDTSGQTGDVWRTARMADSGGDWGFIPIGTNASPFTGTLLGSGFTISGLNIVQPETISVGLFGRLDTSAFVSSVDLYGANIYGLNAVGALAGKNSGSIVNVDVADAAVNGASGVGGGIGKNFGSVYGLNVSDSAVDGTGQYVGGAVGYNGSPQGGGISTISQPVLTNLEFTGGDVIDNTAGAENDVGGLVGYNNVNGVVLNGQVYSSSVTGSGSDVGGLAGRNDGGVSSGQVGNTNQGVQVSGSAMVGGFAGQNTGTLAFDVSWSNTVSGSKYVGGLVGYNGSAPGSTSPALIEGEYQGGSPALGAIFNVFNGLVFGSEPVNQEVDIGGAVGYNGVGGQMLGVSAVYPNVYGAAVHGAGGSPNGGFNVGGLVGDNLGLINYAFSGGQNVIGSQAVGGVAGRNSGIVENAVDGGYGNGKLGVVGDEYVGGVVGYNGGSGSTAVVSNDQDTFGPVYAYGVSGAQTEADAGGIVGYNAIDGIVSSSVAGNDPNLPRVDVISAGNAVGGLVGKNFGKLSGISAQGANVEGYDSVGGIVGRNFGSVTAALLVYGQVSGADYVGGAIGYSGVPVGGALSGVSATVDQVTAQQVEVSWNGAGSGLDFGGFIGFNGGAVTNSYSGDAYNPAGGVGLVSSVQNATGMTNVGGFAGYNAGSIATSYTLTATAPKDGVGATNYGGLVGNNAGTLTYTYNMTDETGLTTAVGLGSSSGAVNVSDSQINAESDGTSPSPFVGFSSSIWFALGYYPALNVEGQLKSLLPIGKITE